MTEKRFGIIKTKTYGLYVPVDKMEVYNFSGFESELDCIRVVNVLNELHEENKELKKQLEREETDKKRLMSYLMKYKGLSFDEIVEDFLDNSYYDNWWENGFYESCWDEYLKEKGFDGCDEE